MRTYRYLFPTQCPRIHSHILPFHVYNPLLGCESLGFLDPACICQVAEWPVGKRFPAPTPAHRDALLRPSPPGSDTPRPTTFHMLRALTPRGPLPHVDGPLSLWSSGTHARPPFHGVASCSCLVLTVLRATAALWTLTLPEKAAKPRFEAGSEQHRLSSPHHGL